MSQSNSPRRTSRKNGLPVRLNHSLDHKLLGYTAAASAAGVGIMTLALPSRAEIVYTPTHQTIPQGGSIALDLNSDGITDFTIHSNHESCSTGPECVSQQLSVTWNGENRVMVSYGADIFAQALPPHQRVGRGQHFTNYGLSFAMMDRCKATRTSFYLSGSWQRSQNSYLGFRFHIGGEIHYGWARLSVNIKGGRCNAAALLTGYAYETVPNKPIITGKTSGEDKTSGDERRDATIGALAVGSDALMAWRREGADGKEF